MTSRPLRADERAFAYQVFGNSVRYNSVSISDIAIEGQVITTHFNGKFTIRWPEGFHDIMRNPGRRATFIHEMTHVWQGCNNGRWSGTYQAKSVVAQVTEGVRDIVRTKDYEDGIKNWDRHRSTAYRIDARRFGRPWSSFNVEQQATIVETWFIDEALRRSRGSDGPGVFGASMSPYDSRFPYIRDVIRKRSPTAAYTSVQLPIGADPAIKALQDVLVALGYLEPRCADGLIGRTNSATLDAVRAFQSRNGLKPDRVLGGANSETRKALARPVGQLQGAG
ncbi:MULTISPECIES: peptidoglycan-binding protein [unclassified Sphingomonas]|uniref:peptidoglycan-binding protein n=1 Tax=unclassified Sphingomonas TaxID=196159 RepID=UPI0006FEC707|nr:MULTISPECIES: peptidoglycan-binding domain-containing protein [unclassified Sphingomonas]KQM62177.1 hypothetical protein ASE65_03960 [Sphingomonas sp. Leaf16]KQN13581.1 hypothetical protein ASE81_04030 [Sphingomonas sp. Leaf29]KQN23186.1 hypothetical protein ASE83_01380 [Sphingomonas sp. Leaf32]